MVTIFRFLYGILTVLSTIIRRNSTMADTIDIRKEAWLGLPGAHIGPDEEVAA